MKLVSLASGSDGNAILVRSERRNILVDAGISLKRIEEGLSTQELCVSDLDAIFITHEHSDHIGGLGVLLRKYEVPVYLTEGTYDAINEKKLIGNVPDEAFSIIRPDKEFKLGDINAHAFSVSHDAAEPVMYKFSEGDSSLAIVTDLGTYDEGIIERLSGINAAVVEANHDVKMLEVGPYPFHLKRRVQSDMGHLSNEASAELIKNIHTSNLKEVMLGHISKINNYEKLALETVRLETEFSGLDVKVSAAPHLATSNIIEV